MSAPEAEALRPQGVFPKVKPNDGVPLPRPESFGGEGQPACGLEPPNAAVRVARSLRILLVEDNATTALVMGKLLGREGHGVSTAGTVREAVSLASVDRPDLLISDLGLPDGNGLELIARVRELCPAVKAVALSGYGMQEDVERSLAAGFDEHLTKPADLATLDAAIRRLFPN